MDCRLDSQRVKDVLLFTLQANKYLSGLQAERTLSTSHTSAAGDEFHKPLLAARKNTDSSLEALMQTPLCKESAYDQFDRQQALNAFRLEVDMHKPTAFKVLTVYNMLIDSIMDLLTSLTNRLCSIKDDRGMGMGCYSSFLSLQNTLSQQCAIVTGTVADMQQNGKIFPMGHLSLVTNLGAQKAYMNTFIRSGVPEEIRNAFVVACHDGPREIQELERVMMVSLQETSAVLSTLSAQQWLHRFTARLNKLSQVHEALMDHAGKLVCGDATNSSAAAQANTASEGGSKRSTMDGNPPAGMAKAPLQVAAKKAKASKAGVKDAGLGTAVESVERDLSIES